MAEYKIEIDREGCIACGSCYSLDPAHFEPGDGDISQVIGGETDETSSSGTFDDGAMDDAQEAADACPVSVITVTEL